MNAILKYHLHQLLNYWHHLRFRIRIEILILFIIFYTFFTDKFVWYFGHVLDQPTTSYVGLATFVLHLLLTMIFLSTPLIYFNLFPKQKGLSNLSLYPLKRSEATALQIIYFIKYQLIIIIIATPILTALVLSTGLLMLVYILFLSSASLYISALMILVMASVYQNRFRVLIQYYIYFLFYMIFFALMYWKTDIFFYTTILVICGAWTILTGYWKKNWQSWDQALNRYRPVAQKSSQNLSKLTYFNFPHLLTRSLRPLFIKEFLSHIRNKNYVRLKIISIALYLSILILIDIFYYDY